MTVIVPISDVPVSISLNHDRSSQLSLYACLPARSDWFDRGDLERMQAVILADRHIIANDEPVRAEMIAGLVGLVSANIVSKGPGSARLAHQMADIVCLVGTKSNDPAKIMMLMPQIRIDPAIGIERRDESVAKRSLRDGLFRAPIPVECAGRPAEAWPSQVLWCCPNV